MSDSAGNDGPPGQSDQSDHTRIIRRHPTGAIPTAGDAEPATSLIPGAAADDPQTSLIGQPAGEAQTSYIARARPVSIPRTTVSINPRSAVATAVVSILSGWATAVIATDLIAGWWRTDRLFCVAIGFLTAISAAATIGGLIALLLRRRMGRLLIVVGSVIGLLIFGSLFLAGAKLQPVVYAMPALPVASILFALLPSTSRWNRSARD